MSESVWEYPRPFESIPPLEICECLRVFESVWRYPGPFEIIWLSDTVRDLQVSESFREYPRPFTPNSEIFRNETIVFLNNFIGDIDAKLLRTCCKILIRFWSAGSVCYSFKISMKYCKIWWQWWWWQWHQMIAWYKKKGWKWRLVAKAVMARGCAEQKDWW